MKVCIIGNSHVAALKLGLDLISSNESEIECDLFGSPNDSLFSLLRKGQMLTSSDRKVAKMLAYTSNGKESIDLNNYDHVLVYGFDFFVHPESAYISKATLNALLKDTLDGGLAFHIFKLISDAGFGNIWISPAPLPAAAADFDGSSDPAEYLAASASCASALQGLGVRLFPQPASTILGNWFTKSEYSTGSIRLSRTNDPTKKAHSSRDRAHMNSEYGSVYLKEFFSVLREHR